MDHKIEIADQAAGAAMIYALDEAGDALVDYWPCLGRLPSEDPATAPHLDILAAFVRDNPQAPLEAMYRHAGGQGVHDRPADGFDDIEPAFRIAYAVFRSTLLEADRVFAEEQARAAARARAEAVQPPVIVPREDTILAQHGSIFDRIGDKPEMVNLGGPVPAASTEGEGGDAELVSGSAVVPAVDGPAAGAELAAVAHGGDGTDAEDPDAAANASSEAADRHAQAVAPAADDPAIPAGSGDPVAEADAPDPVGAAPRVGSRRKS